MGLLLAIKNGGRHVPPFAKNRYQRLSAFSEGHDDLYVWFSLLKWRLRDEY
jgi:hypothetical protein